jgi:hypothetical protein
MVLADVEYELFDWETEWLDQYPTRGYDELYCQIRLLLASGETIYVSWNWGEGRDYYWVAYASESFCTPQIDVFRRVSDTPLWQSLIGNRISLSYLDQDKQVLVIRGEGSVVYCCSYRDGMWGLDSIRVTDVVPERRGHF